MDRNSQDREAKTIGATVLRTILGTCALSLMSRLQAFDFEPGAEIHHRPVSRSQWLWNSQTPVRDEAACYYRLTFNIPEPIAQANLNVHFDDHGKLFVNGKETAAESWQKHLRIGRNVLAFQLKNGFGAAGLLFYGRITFRSGAFLDLHSDSAVKAVATAPDGWQNPDFKDSHWPTAILQGDVLTAPWSRWVDYLPDFTSPGEKATIKAANEAATTLPPGIERETDPVARIHYVNGQPKISVNGRWLDPILHLGGTGTPFQDNIAIKLGKMGVKIFQIGVEDQHFYKAPGNYDFSRLDRYARRLLHLIPDSVLIVSFRIASMRQWCLQHPQDCVGYADGPVDLKAGDDYLQRVLRPSCASTAFQQELKRELAAFTEYLRQQPWSKRVIGFRLSYGIYSEWHAYGMYHGPDTGKAMTDHFRRYLTRKYRTDQALQHAWNTHQVTLSDATPPTMAQRTTPKGILLDPIRNRQTLDFYDCHAKAMADLLLLMARCVKNVFPNRLCGAYYGYVFSTHTPEGANVLLDKVLADPAVDFLSDPSFYGGFSRQAGGCYLHRTIPATHRRYGKLAIIEDDSRFHHLPHHTEPANSTRNPQESYAVVIRNYCNEFFNRSGLQITDACKGVGTRPHTFDDPTVLKGLADARQALAQITEFPAESGNSVAVVMDYRERLRRDGAPKTPPLLYHLYTTAIQNLHRAGIALDVLSLQDFLDSRNGAYRTVIFLNLFGPSETERQAVRKKVRHQDITAIYLIAPGSVTPDGFSDQAMSDLTGISLTGSGTAPQVRCIDPKARPLFKNSVLKVLEDGSRAVFVPSPYQNASLWQQFLRATGCHLYTAPDNYFRRHGNIFMLHTATPGAHRITLPEKTELVTELLSGRKYPANQIVLRTDGPATWIFRLE